MSMRWTSLWAGVGILLMASVAQANVWDNDSGDYLWETATNWTTNSLPSWYFWLNANSSAANPVSLSSTQTITGDGHVGQAAGTGVGYLSQTAGTLTVNGLYVGSEAGSLGVYTISGGTLTTGAWRPFIGNKGTGTLNVSGGTVTFTHSGALLEVGCESGAVGTINVSSGSLSTANNMRIGVLGGSTGSVNQSGGTVSVGSTMYFGSDSTSATGSYTISDGAIFSAATMAGQGIGTLTLDGSRTGSGTDMAFSSNFTLNGLSMLEGIIDAAAIALASDMRMIDVTGTATFANGSKLNVGFDGAPAAGTWTLLTAGTLVNNGLAFAAGVDTNVWSFNATTGAGGSLTVTYVPEPATLALLGLGGLGLLIRRKRS